MDPSSTCIEPFARRQHFDSVVLPHLAVAQRIAQRCTGNRDDADDVAQEAAIRMLCFIGAYRGGDARSWVMCIARNTALSWLRKNRRHDHVPLPEPETWDAGQAPVSLEDAEALRRAVEALPDNHREIVRLRHFRDLSYAEIASTLNVPVGTVMSRLSRARDILREQL